MKLTHTAAALDIDAYTTLVNYNRALAHGLADDLAAGATLDDVRNFIDAEPQLSQREAALILRAAASFIAQRDQEATP